MINLPFPIFPTQSVLKKFLESDSTGKKEASIDNKARSINDFYDNHPFMFNDYHVAASYLGLWGDRQTQTFNAYRNEIEKLMLWCWLIKDMSILDLTSADYSKFLEFCIKPPKEWIMTNRFDKYTRVSHSAYQGINKKLDGYYRDRNIAYRYDLDDNDPQKKYTDNLINPLWRPFLMSDSSSKDSAERIVSEATKTRQKSIISAFYKYLLRERFIQVNPVTNTNSVRKDIQDTRVGQLATQRFSDETWQCMLTMLEEKADKDPVFERVLFAIVLMKACFLRISEISVRKMDGGKEFTPLMSNIILKTAHSEKKEEKNFTIDGKKSHHLEKHWYIEVFGKGSKLRSVSIPNALLPYITRYRNHRGLKGDLPTSRSNEPLIHKLKGTGGVTSKQASRIIKQGFDYFISVMRERDQNQMADEAHIACTHWLRHTGASMAAQTIGILNLSKEMGHNDPSLTARMYLHTDEHKRAVEGKIRDV